MGASAKLSRIASAIGMKTSRPRYSDPMIIAAMTAPATLDIEPITFQNEPGTTCAGAAGELGLLTEIGAGAAEGPDMLAYQRPTGVKVP
jgi:hypothetical protein